ncbi:hypothetical protein ES703_83513 [subsurface metagenome]
MCGFTRLKSLPALSASINSVVTATERLKLVKAAGSSLASMKFIISGWSTLRIAMFAPRRIPPCLITSVAVSKARMKETGPLATPPVEPTLSCSGLNLEKENPVPPPLLWMRAVFFTASKIDSIESSTGRTKQAESWPNSLPAFIRVGELGRNSRFAINP